MKMKHDSEIDDELAKSLADVYGFLALTMRYPDQSFLSEDFLDAFENLLGSLGMDAQQGEINHCRVQDDSLIDTLQVEYTRLFINGVPHVIAPPYGSFYLDGDRTLQGKSTRKARDFYREFGYDIADSSEPADHLRLELEFLSALSRENKLEEGERFLATLFRPWFTAFCNRILEENGHPYYRVSVQLIDFITKEEQ